MPKAYSTDLRERVIAACDQGERAAAVAKRYAVSESFIEKLKQRRREAGTGPRNRMLAVVTRSWARRARHSGHMEGEARQHVRGTTRRVGAVGRPPHLVVSPPALGPDVQKKT